MENSSPKEKITKPLSKGNHTGGGRAKVICRAPKEKEGGVWKQLKKLSSFFSKSVKQT